MKKIALILTLITITPTYATTMCAKNDTVAIVLDPTNLYTDKNTNTTLNIWSAFGPGGTINGTTACLNRGNTYYPSAVTLLHDTNNNEETKLVRGGEKNGPYCWCKLTHPVLSRWVFPINSNRGSLSACLSQCPNHCAAYFIDNGNQGLKPVFFGSITKD